MSSPKITIKEVAQSAGVSIATVSRYLNNPTSLREKNRRRVEKAVQELNYCPLIFARRLAGGKLDAFGLIIPGYEGIFHSYYAMEIIRSVAASLDKDGIDLFLHVYWNRDRFRTSMVDGVIFADVIGNDAQLERLTRENIPLVVINKKIEQPGINYVAVDNYRGAFEATEFLIHHHHKRIAHLAGDMRVQCSQERLDGYKAALANAGIEAKEEYIKNSNFSRKDARQGLEELFALNEVPTAVFCCSDEVASEVLAYCEEENMSVPKQVSVIGFDDNPHCIYGSLMLTTVRQPLIKMAQSAVDILRETIDNKDVSRKVILEPELVIRDTVQFL